MDAEHIDAAYCLQAGALLAAKAYIDLSIPLLTALGNNNPKDFNKEKVHIKNNIKTLKFYEARRDTMIRDITM